MATIDQIYRDNLRLLVQEAGGTVTALAARLGKQNAQVSQWLNGSKDSKTGKPRTLARATARDIERVMNKPEGWMDQPHGELAAQATAAHEEIAEYALDQLPAEYRQLLRDLADIPPPRRSRLLDQIHQVAEESREAAAHFRAREEQQAPALSAAARRGGSRRATTTMTYGDGNRRQHFLPFEMVRDPFSAQPSEREAAWYRHLEGRPRATDR